MQLTDNDELHRYSQCLRGFVRVCFHLPLMFALATFPPSAPANEIVGREPSGYSDPVNSDNEDEAEGVSVTPWLTLFGQVELEWSREVLTSEHAGARETASETPANFQLGFLVRPWSSSRLELVLEYDTGSDLLKADEASVVFDAGRWQVRAGKFYTPLGRYWGNFVNDPVLNFGETRAVGLSLGYSNENVTDLSLMFYQGVADRGGRHADALDWSVSLESKPGQRLHLGLSYQSDLADSDARLLRAVDNRFARKVDALGGFLRWSGPDYEISFEALGALDSFSELQGDRSRPMAWNLEFEHLLHADLHLAWRLEGSRELEDQPGIQAGLALIWQPTQHASINVEYLHGKFKHGLAGNDDDEPYRHVDTVNARVTNDF